MLRQVCETMIKRSKVRIENQSEFCLRPTEPFLFRRHVTRATIRHFDTLDPELDVLQNIYFQPDHVRQRDLARIVSLSLGMINAIIKRLAQKGWLTIKKTNNRNIRYIVSPAGIDEIARRSYHYLKWTIKSIVDYQEAIKRFVSGVKARGFRTVLLLGQSDLDFILEHACQRSGLDLAQTDLPEQIAGMRTPGHYLLYAENVLPEAGQRKAESGVAFLQDIIAGRLPATDEVLASNRNLLSARVKTPWGSGNPPAEQREVSR